VVTGAAQQLDRAPSASLGEAPRWGRGSSTDPGQPGVGFGAILALAGRAAHLEAVRRHLRVACSNQDRQQLTSCATCGSPTIEGDRFCRNCGAVVVQSVSRDVQAGRTLVLISATILLGLHAASLLLTVTVASVTSGVATSDCLRTLVTGSMELCLLYFVFRGHAWARWLTGLLSLAAALLGITFLPQLSKSPAAFASILALVFGMALIAAILLLVPSVRSFQRHQRQSSTAKRRRAA